MYAKFIIKMIRFAPAAAIMAGVASAQFPPGNESDVRRERKDRYSSLDRTALRHLIPNLKELSSKCVDGLGDEDSGIFRFVAKNL